jgi:hypothetical protein
MFISPLMITASQPDAIWILKMMIRLLLLSAAAKFLDLDDVEKIC